MFGVYLLAQTLLRSRRFWAIYLLARAIVGADSRRCSRFC